MRQPSRGSGAFLDEAIRQPSRLSPHRRPRSNGRRWRQRRRIVRLPCAGSDRSRQGGRHTNKESLRAACPYKQASCPACVVNHIWPASGNPGWFRSEGLRSSVYERPSRSGSCVVPVHSDGDPSSLPNQGSGTKLGADQMLVWVSGSSRRGCVPLPGRLPPYNTAAPGHKPHVAASRTLDEGNRALRSPRSVPSPSRAPQP